ncbi:MAG: DUF421 domain-containing protein [Syntrophomonadaceae bacterium]|nr:DUF421 domain-containing protein [Bacillota bacterium]NLP24782.1 DUF421 domain-containing protein [Syntrophomonadaceae bacterium]
MNEGLVVVVRSIIAFLTLLVFARLLGKQLVSQLTFFDYVMGITIGSIAATLSVDLESRAWPHWVGLAVWTIAVLAIQIASAKSNVAAKVFMGEPVVVISKGKLLEDAMGRMRYTAGNLLEQLRNQGIFDISTVEFAVMESDGQLSVLLKPEHRPATVQDLALQPQKGGMSAQLIYDGQVIPENLQAAGVDDAWLTRQLQEQGINNAAEVFLASYHPGSQTLYIDRYEDGISTTTKHP